MIWQPCKLDIFSDNRMLVNALLKYPCARQRPSLGFNGISISLLDRLASVPHVTPRSPQVLNTEVC